MSDAQYWSSVRALVDSSRIVIDRPKGSVHGRHGEWIYPLDYGYLEGTTSGDGQGIDVWVGSVEPRTVTGIVCTIDPAKRDAENQGPARVLAGGTGGNRLAPQAGGPRGAPPVPSGCRVIAINGGSMHRQTTGPAPVERPGTALTRRAFGQALGFTAIAGLQGGPLEGAATAANETGPGTASAGELCDMSAVELPHASAARTCRRER